MVEALTNKRVQAVVSVLTLFYFLCVIVWMSPESTPRSYFIRPIQGIWQYWRLGQSWKLFSPVIRDINYHTSVRITFEDGSNTVWELPRLEKLNQFERFRQERWRKWAVDTLPWPNYKPFWPDLARYAGRKFYNPDNKPVRMSLYLHWANLPNPDMHISRENLPHHSKVNAIFQYRYTPEDFLPNP